MQLAYQPQMYHAPTMMQMLHLLRGVMDTAVRSGQINALLEEREAIVRELSSGGAFNLRVLRSVDYWITVLPWRTLGTRTAIEHARMLAQPTLVVDIPGLWTPRRGAVIRHVEQVFEQLEPMPGTNRESEKAAASYFRNWERSTPGISRVVPVDRTAEAPLSCFLDRVYTANGMFVTPRNIIYSKTIE